MTFSGFLAAGGKVLRGDPCDPCTLISETKCLYLSLQLQPNKQSSGHSPYRSNLREWSKKKKASRHPKEIKAIPAYPTGGAKNINLQSKRQLLWKGKSYLPTPQSAGALVHLRHPLQPPYTSGSGIYYSRPSLWNDGLWNHLSSFNPVRCASVFRRGLWRRSFARGRGAQHLLPFARYEAGPYDFCDVKNMDASLNPVKENGIDCIMRKVVEFSFEFNFKKLWHKYIITVQ